MTERGDSSDHRLEFTLSSPKQAGPPLQGTPAKNDADVENVNLNLPLDSSPATDTLNGPTADGSVENDNGVAVDSGTTTNFTDEAIEAHRIFLKLMKEKQEKDKSITIQPELESVLAGTDVSIRAVSLNKSILVCHCILTNLSFQSAY